MWDNLTSLGRRQTVCKPGSVPPASTPMGRTGGRGWPFIWDVRCRTPHATDPSGGAEGPPGSPGNAESACRSYLVLLPVGFSLPPPLPAARCALTAPFHPCRPRNPTKRRNGLGGMFSVALSLGSPPPGVTRHRASVEPGLSSPRPTLDARAQSGHPTVWHGIMWDQAPPPQSPCRAPNRSRLRLAAT